MRNLHTYTFIGEPGEAIKAEIRRRTLPNGYTLLRYIDSNFMAGATSPEGRLGGYIDTGLTGLVGRSTVIEIAAVSDHDSSVYTDNAYWNFLVAAQTTDNDSGTIQIRRVGPSYPVDICSNKSASNTFRIDKGVEYKYILDGPNNRFYCNDQFVTSTSMTRSATHSLCVFHSGYSGWLNPNKSRFWKGRVGYMKVWSSGVLVAHYYPAKRNSDEVCGYYDVIRNRFDTSCTETPIIGIPFE